MHRIVILALMLALVWTGQAMAQLDEGETIKLRAEWTVDEARVTALKNIESSLDTADLRGMDPKLLENLKALETTHLKVANRRVTYFEGGLYAVAYDGEDRVHYYEPDGKLIKVSVCSEPFGENPDYPRRCIDYSYPEGKFISVSLDVSPRESFIFSFNGTLLNHWKGGEAYDPEGNVKYERWAN